MDYCREEIRKMFKQLPDTYNKQRIEDNIIEIAEDKYQELIETGLSKEEVRSQVLESIGSLEDIREALDIENIEKEYGKKLQEHNKNIIKNIINLFIMPIIFFTIDYIFNSEFLNSITFFIVVVLMIYFLYKICDSVNQKLKCKKTVEGYFERKIRRLRVAIILTAISLFFVCAAVDAPGYLVLLLMIISFGTYRGIKYYIKK